MMEQAVWLVVGCMPLLTQGIQGQKGIEGNVHFNQCFTVANKLQQHSEHQALH
jgi:hypothetical protein